jgi:uncharacterized protein (TIGR02466 family)
MSVRRLFPTLIYQGTLRQRGFRDLNAQLLRECRQLRADDSGGRRWSARNYPGGYTSYDSASRMHEISPTFASLQKRLDRHVLAFANRLQFDLRQRRLSMTDCWVNIMARNVVHGLHLHPLATISGTYYVKTPPGCSALKFEDPRLERYMAAPPRRARPRSDNQTWVSIGAQAGALILFESWLRHEVAANPVSAERVSISFNYGWF